MRENIEVVLEMKKISKEKQKKKVEQLLEEFRLTHVRNSLGYTLSGGERRRIEIARTIANDQVLFYLMNPLLELIR